MSDNVDISAKIKVNDQASAAIGAMRGALQGLGNVAAKAGQSMRNLGTTANFNAAVKGLGGSLRGLGGAVMNIVKPVAALAGIGGGIGMAEAVAGMQSYVDATKELTRTAPIVGTSIERLSELQYAAGRVGISSEEMTGALTRANAAIGKAATGKGTLLTSLFQKLNISLRDANGNLRASPDVLMQFANAIQRQTDPVTKLRMATELFGRAAGPEMLKLLSQGEAGIAEFIRQGREMNVIVSDKQAQEALEFAKSQAEVRRVWQSLSVTLSQNLMPVLRPLIDMFAKLLAENKVAIVASVTNAFKALAKAIEGIKWEETINSIKAWVKWVDGLVKSTVGWETVLGLLALSMTGLLGPLTAVTLAIGKLAIALVGLAIANPMITAIVLGIAALAAAGYLIYQHWDKVKAFFIDLWEGVRAAFVAVDEWLGPWGNLFAPFVIYRNWGAVVQFFKDLWPQVKEAFWVAVDWLEPFAQLWLPYAIYKNWDELAEFFADLWEDVKEIFWAVIDWLGEFFAKWTPDVNRAAWDGMVSWLRGIWDSIVGIFESAWKKITPIIDALKTAGGWGAALWNAPGRLFDKVTGGGSKPAGQTVVQQAAGQQATSRVDGQVGVDIHMHGAPPGTTIETTQRGQVRATGDVGRSMATS